MVLSTMETGIEAGGVITCAPLRLYTGVLGQVGDIICFTPTVRRLRELFPRAEITFAVSRRYQQAGELVAGLPYIDRLFVTDLYFEKLCPALFQPWERGWPVDFRGDDEIREQRRHHLILETRPRHRRTPWWEYAHQVEEMAHMVGVPGPIDRRTEVAIPPETVIPPQTVGKVVFHNDPAIDLRKAWPWERATEFIRRLGPDQVVLLGNSGPAVPGALDLRGRTTLAQAAAIIRACRCYVGIDSGLMWIAASLQVPAVGLYGTDYIPAYEAIHPENGRAHYLQVEGSLDQIAPDEVLERVEHLIGEQPSLSWREGSQIAASPGRRKR